MTPGESPSALSRLAPVLWTVPMDRPRTRWIAGCAVAEAVGLGTAAAAALLAAALGDRPGGMWPAVGVIVAGGLVEGLCLGAMQAWLLARALPLLDRRLFVAVTVLIAGVGWAAGSAPMVVTADDGAAGQPLVVLLLGAAGLGLLMGGLLGAAQAWTLRRAAGRPAAWVWANLAAWPGAMVLIFLGTSLAGGDWPAYAVVLLGAGTGAAAGAALGLVLGRGAAATASVNDPRPEAPRPGAVSAPRRGG